MTSLESIRERMAGFLRDKGLDAISAYPAENRKKREGAAVAVSLRGYEGGPAGFQDYLGERYNTDTGRWEELYGKKLKLTFGLDLYAPPGGAAELERTLSRLSEALHGGGPEGLELLEMAAGETDWSNGSGLLKLPVEARCGAYLYAVADEGGQFLDFEIRGERIK